jgi:glycosyltransferase involved in cell wall biosynthesis
MKSSVIIPTAGRPAALESALRALLALAPSRHDAEILVVDNNGDDALCEALRNHCAQFDGAVRYVREPSPGLTAARHRGVREAHGEVLSFVDDDVEVGAGWLAAIQAGFRDLEVGLIGGPSVPRFTGSVPAWFWGFLARTPYGGWMCPWLSLIDVGRDVRGVSPLHLWGLNFSIRRSVLERCGGFHPDLVPAHLQRWQGDGETGLARNVQAAGIRCDYLHDALVFHQCGPERLNPEYFGKRAYYQGVAESFTEVRSGRDPRPGSKPADRSLVRRALGAARGMWKPEGHGAIDAATRAARVAGWRFHQAEVAADPKLLRWARRADFMDADIRREAA